MKTIQIYEKVLVGNFAGETNDEQRSAANKYSEMMNNEISEYCNKNYPDYEVEIDIDMQNASGCSRGLQVSIEDDTDDFENYEINKQIEETITHHIEFFQDKISEEIYED